MPSKYYEPGKVIGKFKPGQGMLIGYEKKHSVKYGTGSAAVKSHITATTKTKGGKGFDGQSRAIDHFHVTIEDGQGKLGQFNHGVSNGSIGAGKWGGNGRDIPDDMMKQLEAIDADHKKTMEKLV